MKKDEVIINNELSGTLSEGSPKKYPQTSQTTKEIDLEFGVNFDAIQQTWSVNPVDEQEYDGILGYKDS